MLTFSTFGTYTLSTAIVISGHHLVHEAHAWHVVLVCLTPHRLALWFHSSHTIEHSHGTVQDAQGSLHLTMRS